MLMEKINLIHQPKILWDLSDCFISLSLKLDQSVKRNIWIEILFLLMIPKRALNSQSYILHTDQHTLIRFISIHYKRSPTWWSQTDIISCAESLCLYWLQQFKQEFLKTDVEYSEKWFKHCLILQSSTVCFLQEFFSCFWPLTRDGNSCPLWWVRSFGSADQ